MSGRERDSKKTFKSFRSGRALYPSTTLLISTSAPVHNYLPEYLVAWAKFEAGKLLNGHCTFAALVRDFYYDPVVFAAVRKKKSQCEYFMTWNLCLTVQIDVLNSVLVYSKLASQSVVLTLLTFYDFRKLHWSRRKKSVNQRPNYFDFVFFFFTKRTLGCVLHFWEHTARITKETIFDYLENLDNNYCYTYILFLIKSFIDNHNHGYVSHITKLSLKRNYTFCPIAFQHFRSFITLPFKLCVQSEPFFPITKINLRCVQN